jgi:PAS domain S-box-containing protein
MPDPSHEPPRSELAVAQDAQAAAEGEADSMRISERRYRRLFEMARDGILILDSEFGRVTDANPFMTELLGYSHEDLIGKELWEIGLLKDKDASQHAFQQLKREHFIRYDDLPLENRRGERREVEFVSNVYRENGHTVIQCNIRDITERKRVDAILAISATRNERIADLLQRSMLQSSPAGEFSGIAVETLYEAALNEAEVGGDFFDAFALDSQTVALVVGDVSGKGLVAAVRTSEVKYVLRGFLHEHRVPSVALARLNDFICTTHLPDKDNGETFIVLALAVVDTTTGEATFAAAGAEPTLILRRDGKAEPVELTGVPLGIVPGSTYNTATEVLELGDTVVMTTDGITEARHESSFLGTKGLSILVERAGSSSTLLMLTQAIYAGALDFAGGRLRDDVCLLVARRKN